VRRVRDRTVARVDALQREIRKYGKHAFRKDPKLCAAFASEYLRRQRRKSGEQEIVAAPAATSTQPAIGGDGSPFTNQ
jgi:hypothetical protein